MARAVGIPVGPAFGQSTRIDVSGHYIRHYFPDIYLPHTRTPPQCLHRKTYLAKVDGSAQKRKGAYNFGKLKIFLRRKEFSTTYELNFKFWIT